jgi:hypothetical protein
VSNDLPSIFLGSLPSAKQKTLGKKNTRQRNSLSSILFLTLGKEFFAECFFDSRQRVFAEIFNTRQRVSLPSVLFWTLGKDNLKIIF